MPAVYLITNKKTDEKVMVEESTQASALRAVIADTYTVETLNAGGVAAQIRNAVKFMEVKAVA